MRFGDVGGYPDFCRLSLGTVRKLCRNNWRYTVTFRTLDCYDVTAFIHTRWLVAGNEIIQRFMQTVKLTLYDS
jgi:hypothetical protein